MPVIAVIVISVGIAAVGIGWIIWLFVQDHRIATHGRVINAVVEDVRTVKRNESDSVTIRYRLAWGENGAQKYVDGSETIPASRETSVRIGQEITVQYLDDDNLRLVFDQAG